eukprot:jgi/Mesvir1/23388/Mv21083-RA.1
MPMRQKVTTPPNLIESSWKERFETLSASVKKASETPLPTCCFCHGPSKSKKYVRLVPMSARLVHECNVILCPECATNMRDFHRTKADGATTNMKCPLCMCDVVTHAEKFFVMDHALNEFIASTEFSLCEHGCGSYLSADELKQHDPNCSRNRYECGFNVDLRNEDGTRAKMGCSLVGKKDEIVEHMKACYYYHEASAVRKLKEKADQVNAVKNQLATNVTRAREALMRLFGFRADEMDAVMERLAQKEMERGP